MGSSFHASKFHIHTIICITLYSSGTLMLLIISDLHLGDGTTANSIPVSAFKLFAGRLQETVQFASWRQDGKYRPIEDVDIVLMGDIIDPLHSTLWLDTMPGDADYIRPWS